jgi:RimJ/RimL family protein N-acetyltransferase
MRWPPNALVLEGAVVRLERIEAAHHDGLLAAAGDPETWTWMDRRIPEDDGAFTQWFEARLEASKAAVEWCFVTRSSATGEPIGSSSYLSPRPEHNGLEIGWTWLHPSAWRTGANLEAKLLMLEHAFDELGCMRVEFKTDARNERSREALTTLPATFEGVFRKHMMMPGVGIRDSAYFSIVDDEWRAVRSNLERRLADAGARQPQALGSRDA